MGMSEMNDIPHSEDEKRLYKIQTNTWMKGSTVLFLLSQIKELQRVDYEKLYRESLIGENHLQQDAKHLITEITKLKDKITELQEANSKLQAVADAAKKEQDKITRHACAEAVLIAASYGPDGDVDDMISVSSAENACINAQALQSNKATTEDSSGVRENDDG